MPPRQGTGFINWNQFVNANRGTAGRLAGELDAGVQAGGQDASKKFYESQAQFAGAVRDAENQGVTEYTGPSSWADLPVFQEGQQAADKAAKDSRQLANIWGRAGMLGKKYAATPGYGTGQQAFDSALLGSVGQGSFETTRSQYGGLPQRYADGLAQSAQLGSQAHERAAGRRTQPAAPAPPASPLDDFVRQPPVPRGPDLAVDAPWTAPRPKKRGEEPYI
jgi:hypothetical protein